MSYELSYKYEPDYLHIEVTGVRTVENFIAITKDLLTEAEKHGYQKLLLDMRSATGGLKLIDLYTVETKHLSTLWRTMGHPQVAVVDLEANRERFKFMETVSVNQGVNVRIFTDVDEAIEWLNASKTPAGK